jgi:hypothetical protein
VRLWHWLNERVIELMLCGLRRKPRPMTGLVDRLTPEQWEAIRAYDGPEVLGPPDGSR